MDELIDRLAALRPAPTYEPDIDRVRERVRRRRQRRTAAAGLAGVVLVAVAGLGAGRLLAAGEDEPRRLTATGAPETVPDRSMEPIGPEREVASGPLPDRQGTWTYYAYETTFGIATRLDSPLGGYGGGVGVPPYDDVMLVGYSSGGSEGSPNDAQANVRPEVDLVRFELSTGGVVEVEPVDVGFPIEFVYTLLPDGVGVERAVALDAEGRVLVTRAGFVPVPDE